MGALRAARALRKQEEKEPVEPELKKFRSSVVLVAPPEELEPETDLVREAVSRTRERLRQVREEMQALEEQDGGLKEWEPYFRLKSMGGPWAVTHMGAEGVEAFQYEASDPELVRFLKEAKLGVRRKASCRAWGGEGVSLAVIRIWAARCYGKWRGLADDWWKGVEADSLDTAERSLPPGRLSSWNDLVPGRLSSCCVYVPSFVDIVLCSK